MPARDSVGAALSTRVRGEIPYLVCAAIALVTIWGHRYPVGIDIAQHANLFRISTDVTWGPIEWRSLYRFQPFAPYLLAYAVAYPFALLFGAIAAAKCVLTLAALTTPLMMRRWLKVIGANSELALFGFLVAFDFQYHWGFVSHELAMPLAFGYLAAFERQGVRPGWRAVGETLAFGVALFFCHGITFGLCMLIAAARIGLCKQPLAAWRSGLHALPVGLLAIYWSRVHSQQTGDKPGNDWADLDRLIRLFSGPFAAYPHRTWALVSIVGLVLVLIAALPRVVWQSRRLVPLAVSVLAFLALPETLAATWMIGSRFCVFIHAFAPAALAPRTTGWLGKKWSLVALGWIVFVLVSLNLRLSAYNDEIAGLHELTSHIEPGFDVRTMLPETVHDSETMGQAQFGQAAAWVTAELGGILENDSADYYQMPIRRSPVPFPASYRYIVAKGDVDDATRKTTAKWPAARLIHQASSWLLFEDPPMTGDGFTVIRSMQSWGRLQQDKSAGDVPLSIAGTPFLHGLGAHASSFLRIRIDRTGRTFSGACGIDDSAGHNGLVSFRIRDNARETLFESGEIRGGEAARRFSVALAGRSELILEVNAVESIDYGHGDWVDLRVD
jgi:hypothetical protein